MNSKDKAIKSLKAWSEDAILCAELDTSPSLDALKKIKSEAKAAGMSTAEIEELVWSPYADLEPKS